MDATVNNESAKINHAINVWGDMENDVCGQIIEWMLFTHHDLSGLEMKEVIELYWSERLSYE